MENLTIEQWLEKYPYLRKMQESILFIAMDLDEAYKSDEKIDIGTKEISINLLINLVQNDEYYTYVKKLFNDEIDEFQTRFIVAGDTAGGMSLNKVEIVKGLDLIMQMDELLFDDKALERYNEIRNKISFDKFIEKNQGNTYDIEIDGITYSISFEEIIDFMQIPNDEFDKICNSNDIKMINGMPKAHFAYAAYKFFRDSGAFCEYIIPSEIEDRFDSIKKSQKIDIEALNKFLTTYDPNIEQITISDELKEEILEGFPVNANKIEQDIYIYIKICKTLTYDDEFYAVNQMGDVARKHENIKRISTITPKNNKVVCYEFNAIYGKFLDELGTKFKTNQALLFGFGGGHAYLKYRSDKFLVSADSVTSILQGDMMRAKLNQPLVGLKCLNANIETQKEFYDLVTKMYNLIASQENAKAVSRVEHVETFEDVLAQYQKTILDVPKIDLDEKLDILVNKVNRTKMTGIDSLSYVLQLRTVLFTEEERKNNIGVTIIRNNEPYEENQLAMASAIFTLNKQNVTQNKEQNLYYFYNPNSELSPISLDELEDSFSVGRFDYISTSDPKIPGLATTRGVKK